MKRILFDEVIETDYGQFDLNWGDDYGFDGDFNRFFAGQENGLAGAASGQGLYAIIARRSGGSRVTITLHDTAPDDDDAWEDVVEVSVDIPEGCHPSWSTWAGETSGSLALPPGSYRVRVNARGRDAGSGQGEFADKVVDFYLIEFWSAPVRPDAILRTVTTNAAYWHGEIGSQR